MSIIMKCPYLEYKSETERKGGKDIIYEITQIFKNLYILSHINLYCPFFINLDIEN